MGDAAPYVANGLLVMFGAVYNFLGYKQYSFNHLGSPPPEAGISDVR
jgi:hypothetical protein